MQRFITWKAAAAALLLAASACGKAPSEQASKPADLVGDGPAEYAITDWGADGMGATSRAIIDPQFKGMIDVLTRNASICFDEATSLQNGNGFILYNCAFRTGNLVWAPRVLFLKRGALIGTPEEGNFYLTTANGASVGTLHSYLGLNETTWYALGSLCNGTVAHACDLAYQSATRIFQLSPRG